MKTCPKSSRRINMSLLSAIIILLGGLPVLPAQQLDSRLGAVHTPKGHLHLLVIFVRYEDKDLQPWSKPWPNSDQLPEMARGENNNLFYATPEPLKNGERKRNISDFYYTMSGGQFILTADIYPVQVPVKYIPEHGVSFFGRQTRLNEEAIKWIAINHPEFDWSRYDNRTNNPRYMSDNSDSKPDNILDYVVFLHRAPGGQTGMAATGSFRVPNGLYKVQDGLTAIKCYTEAKHQWEYFKHEFSHNLFDAPHYMGANGTDGDHYYLQRGWGLMSTLNPPFFTANAWERWWLGWFEPQEVTKKGTYTLKDFVSTGDAIRIQLPGTQNTLWIENHQKTDLWDDKLFYTSYDKGHPRISDGLYAFVVANPGADRHKPKLRTFNPKDCNLMKILNGQGHWDYSAEGRIDMKYFKNAPVFKKEIQNPIAGQNDLQAIRLDYNKDGKIPVGMIHGNRDGRAGEHNEIWVEERKGEAVVGLNNMGNEDDRFHTGDELGLSGIVPLLNYPSWDKTTETLSPYVLNGITIRVVQQFDDGSYELEIELDDWEVREDKRWCGNILLPYIDTQTDKHLTISKRTNILLDLSGTPDRSTAHPQTGTCSNPTRLLVEGGRGIRLQKGSQMIVDRFSELELATGSQLIIEKGASLIVRGEGKLILQEDCQVIVRNRGKLIIEADGYLEQIDDKAIQVARRGKFQVKR